MKTWLLVKHWYGDDCGLQTVLAAGPENLIKQEANRLENEFGSSDDPCVHFEAEVVPTLSADNAFLRYKPADRERGGKLFKKPDRYIDE